MKDNFVKYILENHKRTQRGPTTESIIIWIKGLKKLLFPETIIESLDQEHEVDQYLNLYRQQLKDLLSELDGFSPLASDELVDMFFASLPQLYQDLHLDVDACYNGDPAAISYTEIIRSYPGFYGVFIYRIAHALYILNVPLIPRILTEYAHQRTGIDIHPGAVIGKSFFIDHGTGVVIGETSVIGHHVKIYQGVTLGALSIDKDMAGKVRHPKVEDHVVIYSGATILGGETVIGEGSVIGGNVWITKSVPPYTKIYHVADNNQIVK